MSASYDDLNHAILTARASPCALRALAVARKFPGYTAESKRNAFQSHTRSHTVLY